MDNFSEWPKKVAEVSNSGQKWAWLGESLRQKLIFPLLSLFTPLEVKGLEHLQDKGPFIFAVNHSSHLDTPLLLAALPSALRMQTRVAAAADYFFSSSWKGTLVSNLLNAFPFVRQGANRVDSLVLAQQLLNAGQNLVLFPEGTRTTDGKLQTFKWGVGWLATHSEAAVVPVWIEGTRAAMPKGARWPRRHSVLVSFGAPRRFLLASDSKQVAAEIERQVQNLSPASDLAQAA